MEPRARERRLCGGPTSGQVENAGDGQPGQGLGWEYRGWPAGSRGSRRPGAGRSRGRGGVPGVRGGRCAEHAGRRETGSPRGPAGGRGPAGRAGRWLERTGTGPAPSACAGGPYTGVYVPSPRARQRPGGFETPGSACCAAVGSPRPRAGRWREKGRLAERGSGCQPLSGQCAATVGIA